MRFWRKRQWRRYRWYEMLTRFDWRESRLTIPILDCEDWERLRRTASVGSVSDGMMSVAASWESQVHFVSWEFQAWKRKAP